MFSPGFERICVPIPEPAPNPGAPIPEPMEGELSVDGPNVDGPNVDGFSVVFGTDEGADWYVGGPIGVTLIAPGTLGTVGTLGTIADETP